MAKRSGLSARRGSIQAAIAAAKGEPAPESEDALNANAGDRSRAVGLTLRLDRHTHDRLRRIAFEERVSLHSLLLEGVEATLAKHESLSVPSHLTGTTL